MDFADANKVFVSALPDKLVFMKKNYTLRQLTDDDAHKVDTFLKPHTVDALYLRSNALNGGFTYNGNRPEGEYLGAFYKEQLVGIVSYQWLNTLLVFAVEEDCIPLLATALEPYLLKRHGKIEGILGLKAQGNALCKALGITPEDMRICEPEWLYTFDVTQSTLVSHFHTIRYAREEDKATLIAWRVAFNIEASNTLSSPELVEKVTQEIEERLKQQEFVVLEREGMLRSFCSISSFVSEAAMIGSVYTPPHHRNQGFARDVVKGAIALAKQTKPTLEKIVLFASNTAAVKAYTNIGFVYHADFFVGLLKESYRWKPQ
ncbi:MAG: GNAT family N-acetyltransferase [Alphaproteobacteria bacterium]|nr:GNAT family N-acetyltransferase [Alphaproteobacteria bacterium]